MTTIHSSAVTRANEARILDVFGVRVTVLAGGEESEGTCSIARLVCPPGCGAPPHRHSEAENFHVIRGVLSVQLDGENIELRPGDLIHVAPGAVHAFQNATAEDVEFYAVATPAGHERFFREADALAKSGGFNPQSAAELCRRNGIELVQ